MAQNLTVEVICVGARIWPREWIASAGGIPPDEAAAFLRFV
jgi:hypothetical protein